MASTIRIKRSGTTSVPGTLKPGELAYSWATGSNKLFIGSGSADANGDANNVHAIGGYYYTQLLDGATSANTAEKIVVRDASGNFSAGTITAALSGNASTASKWATARTVTFGTGDATGSFSIDGSADVSNVALSLATVLDGSTGKVTGTYGSVSAVPVITVDAKGRITGITSSAISTGGGVLSIAGDGSTTDSVTVGTDTLTFAGGTGVTTTVTNNQVSFAIGQAVSTNSNVTFNNLTISGNLTVNGTTTTVNSTTTTIDDPIITLGGDGIPTSDDNKDRGIEFKWHNGADPKTGFFGFDDSTGYLTFIPDAENTNEVFSGTQGDIQATNFRGELIGNAATATKWATARTVTFGTGDATGSFSIDGSANVSNVALTLATLLDNTTNKVAGTFGTSTAVPEVTVDAKGRVTQITTNNIPTATSSVLGLASFNSSDFTVTNGAVTINTVDGGTY